MSDPITVAGVAGKALTALQYVGDFKQRANEMQRRFDAGSLGDADSLVSYSKPARAEPITMVDARAINLTYTRDILMSLTSLYAGYYLQAISLAVGVGRINVTKLLDQFNPERSGDKATPGYLLEASLGELAKNGHLLSAESYRFNLPGISKGKAIGLEAYREAIKDNPEAQKQLNVAIEAFSLEAVDNANAPAPQDAMNGRPKTREPLKTNRGLEYGMGKDTVSDIHEVPNLAVGKMLEVQINDGQVKGSFPVAVRLLVSSVDPDTLVHILGDGVKDSSTKERWHAWRSGAINLTDMLFAVDAIDAHRATMLKDKSGTYKEIMRRRRQNGLTTLRSGIAEGSTKTSIGTASNLVVITEQTLKELERHAGIRFSNAAQRKAVFDMSYLMIVAVVDTDYEHVTFYTRGIATPTELTMKQIQSANKGNGPDVAEILKAYRLGSSPSL